MRPAAGTLYPMNANTKALVRDLAARQHQPLMKIVVVLVNERLWCLIAVPSAECFQVDVDVGRVVHVDDGNNRRLRAA